MAGWVSGNSIAIGGIEPVNNLRGFILIAAIQRVDDRLVGMATG